MTASNGLPAGWIKTMLSELVSKSGVFVDGDWVESKDQDPNGDVRLIQLADVGDGAYRNRSSRFLTSQKAKEINCTFLAPGDLLIARMPDPLGRACIFPGDSKKSVTVVDVCIVRPGDTGVNNRWLMHAINSPAFRIDIAALQSGSTRKRISRSNLACLLLPVPPLAEQRRIVAKIEELFTKLDVGVESLKAAKKQLKRYRQSVLKAAVEGTLTAERRQEHPHPETAPELLKRILAERRRRWEEEQLRKFKEKGQEPPKNWKAKYKEPVSAYTFDLPTLPDAWCWATLDQLSSFVTSGSRGWKEYYTDEGALFIRSQDIRTDRLELDNVAHVSPPMNSEGMRTQVHRGDFLVTITGANVAKAAIVEVELSEAFVSQHVGLIRLVASELGKFIHKYAIASSGGRKRLLASAYGAGKPGLNLDNLRELPIPLPPTSEREVIVEAIEDQLSVIEHLEATLDAELKRAERLRQSILKRAFEGKLVPQDPNDEPASVLLERIKAERAEKESRSSNGKRTARGRNSPSALDEPALPLE